MTDQPAATAASDAPETAEPPETWKPEPRQWTWKDLFTAPMLAFKPKCMLVSALTLVALGLWFQLYLTVIAKVGEGWGWPVTAGFLLIGLAVFGLGATLVAVFMKADLLDDEFLSFGEAFTQYKSRILAAILVPVFLAVLVAGIHGLLVWLPMFVGSIPYAGGLLYALLYPLGFFAAVFALLMIVAVTFSLFVFPAIVAIRRHGWFDNVVDTIEAVGTRPHILVASLALTGAFTWFAYTLGTGATGYLRTVAAAQPAWGQEHGRPDPARVETRATEISQRALAWIDPVAAFTTATRRAWGVTPATETEPFHRWGSGLIAGGWQTLIGALLLGYCFNLFIGGGMLTYLVVREDDYWDDEDLEDLDKLAKELEEEAKREEAGTPAAAAAPASPPAAAPAVPPTDGSATLPTQIIPPKE